MVEYLTMEYKKYLAEHYVLDAWQFVANTRKNVATAGYCYLVIESLILKTEEEHRGWQEDFQNDLNSMVVLYCC